jgi:hypothetical protein
MVDSGAPISHADETRPGFVNAQAQILRHGSAPTVGGHAVGRQVLMVETALGRAAVASQGLPLLPEPQRQRRLLVGERAPKRADRGPAFVWQTLRGATIDSEEMDAPPGKALALMLLMPTGSAT